MAESILVSKALLKKISALWPDDMSDDGSGRIGWMPHAVAAIRELREALDPSPAIDLDAEDWEAIKRAAAESSWMPPEYMRNEWVNDVCAFLRNGAQEHQAQPETLVPDECPHMIVFDDDDRTNELFAGAGARPAAMRRWEQISTSWNAHLFLRVACNSRNAPYPSASYTAALKDK